MNRALRALAALGAALVFSGCEGADAGIPEDANVDVNGFVELPDYSHEYLIQPVTEAPQAVINADGETVIHADPAILFKGAIPADHPMKVDDISTPEQDAETLKVPTPQLEWHPPLQGNTFGMSQQAIFMSLLGPGYQIDTTPINSRNTMGVVGPCYEDTSSPIATNHDCEVPNFTVFNTPYAFDVNLNQQFCTSGTIAHGAPGSVSIIGNNNWNHAFDAWKAGTGIPFKAVASGTGELISIICVPLAEQNRPGETTVLESGGPWGFTTLRTDATPQFVTPENQFACDHCTPSGFNYPITKARNLYTYGAGIIWVDDTHVDSEIQRCTAGKTATQKDRMARTYTYALAAHEIGHVLAFWHTGSGPMKPTFDCPDMGDGSAIFEAPIPAPYGQVYQLYSAALRGQHIGPTNAGPAPPLNHNSDLDQSQVFILN